MERDFKELANKISEEVLHYLVKESIDLSNSRAVNEALNTFESKVIVDYMDENELELGYMFEVTTNNVITIDVWEW